MTRLLALNRGLPFLSSYAVRNTVTTRQLIKALEKYGANHPEALDKPFQIHVHRDTRRYKPALSGEASSIGWEAAEGGFCSVSVSLNRMKNVPKTWN